MVTRPSIDAVLIRTAHEWAARGTCARLQVGAVLATDTGHIVTHGYNGALSGMPHHTDAQRDTPCDQCEHAERNALYFAARRGVSTLGTTAYLTHSPCLACARGLVQAGVSKVLYATAYRSPDGLDLLMRAGVPAKRWDN